MGISHGAETLNETSVKISKALELLQLFHRFRLRPLRDGSHLFLFQVDALRPDPITEKKDFCFVEIAFLNFDV